MLYQQLMGGGWRYASEIDYDALPDRFVLKTTHGGGSLGVVICADKKTFDRDAAGKILSKSLASDIYSIYREWPYKDVPRRIIAEEYIETPDGEEMTDYKFFCFNGTPRYVQVIKDRKSGETIDFFDMEWNHQPFVGLNPGVGNSGREIPRPRNFEKMIEIAAKLSSPYPFVRVDLYNIDGRILFGELTFFPGSGLGRFEPDEWNLKLGEMIRL